MESASDARYERDPDPCTDRPSDRPTAERLDRMGGVRRLHVLVLGGSLLLTLGAWAVSARALEQRNRARFARQADVVVEALAETLERHAGMLRAAAGFVESSGDDARDAWRDFSGALDLERRYPALGGLAVVRRVPRDAMPALVAEHRRAGRPFDLRPAHDEPFHLPIVMVARDLDAGTMLGYDLAFERERRAAVAEAFARDEVRLTAPVRPARGEAAGAVMVAPYRAQAAGDVDAGPPERFAGVVATSMLFEHLLAGALDPARREVRLRIDDGGRTLVDEPGDAADPEIDPAPLLVDERSLAVHGRDWRLRIETTRGFRAGADVAAPWVVLGSGLVIDALLAALLRLHLRGGRRLLVAARRLRAERAALAQSNEMLEAFASVVSHDLKAPLLGIRMLVDALEEDVRDGRPDGELLDILARLRAKAGRADALVEGVLEYSGLGEREETSGPVDVGALLADVRESLDLGEDVLGVGGPVEGLGADGSLPTIDTVEVRLRQVLVNLVGNALKYHDAPERARVRVRVERTDEGLRFAVADDGPGIEPCHRARIFEPFVKAHGTDRADSTGLGLAIVRKNVEAMGGAIELAPGAGRGATFVFTWPTTVLAESASEAGSDAGDGATDGPARDAPFPPRLAA